MIVENVTFLLRIQSIPLDVPWDLLLLLNWICTTWTSPQSQCPTFGIMLNCGLKEEEECRKAVLHYIAPLTVHNKSPSFALRLGYSKGRIGSFGFLVDKQPEGSHSLADLLFVAT